MRDDNTFCVWYILCLIYERWWDILCLIGEKLHRGISTSFQGWQEVAVRCDDDATWSHIVWHLITPGHITWHLVMHLAGGNCVMMASGQWPYTWQMMASGNGIYSVTPDLYMSGNWLRPIGCICVFFNKVALDLECHIWFLCVPYLVSYDGFSIAKKMKPCVNSSLEV